MKRVISYCTILALFCFVVNLIAMPNAFALTTEVTLPYNATGRLTKILDVRRPANVHVVKFSGGGATKNGIARVLEVSPGYEEYIIPKDQSDCRIPLAHGERVYSAVGLAFVHRSESNINTIFAENTTNAAIPECQSRSEQES